VKVLATLEGIKEELDVHRRAGSTIGVVPTMGALHDGHLSLVRAAREGCEVVVLSIFVNPLQFGPNEDFRNYPRTIKQDLAAADRAGVDLVFLPDVHDMYPDELPQVGVSSGSLGDVLEGASRPGHFDGVCTVVAKLFNILRPDSVYFGQKDAQQVAVIRRMIEDLSYPIELHVCPTLREADGLALSSRNAYLSPEQRQRATILYLSLEAGREALETAGDPTLAEKKMNEVLEADPYVEVDYARAVNPSTFESPAPGDEVLLVVAAKVGRTRLIDNLHVSQGSISRRRA
jgi:pantoate--beta-alanine ligase